MTRNRMAGCILALGAIGVSIARAQESDVTTKTERTPLDGPWLFRTDPTDVGVRENWHSTPIDGEWKPIRVPGTWEDQGFRDYDGPAWYRRTFELPPSTGAPRGIAVMGCDDEAMVWVNGQAIPASGGYLQRIAFDIEKFAKPGKNELCIRVLDNGGPGGIIRSVVMGPFRNVEDLMRGEFADRAARASADWVRDAVIYEVYVRSFSPEGTFRGVEKRLDELKTLGVTVIWLMPIQPVGKEKRKGSLGSPYAPQDYYGINPEFGTLEDFKSLLKSTHDRGMKLIIDLVANHTSWDAELLRKHPEWYERNAKGEIRTPVDDWSDVAQLDYRKPELREYMTEMMLYWVRDVGIDGFRCDVAGMVPSDFWESVRPKLDAVKPVMMLAEDDNPAQHLKSFDVTYDWGLYRINDGLKDGKLTSPVVALHLRDERLDYPAGNIRMRFADNHDKNAWVAPGIKRYGPQGMRAAYVMTFCLPGAPLIYNGDEVANATPLPLFERVPIDWAKNDQGMRAFITGLARLRRERESLRRGDVMLIDTATGAAADPGVLAFVRATPREKTLVVLNLTTGKKSIALGGDLPTGGKKLLSSGAISGDGMMLELPPLGYWIGTVER